LEDGSLLNEQLVRRGYARVSALRDDARYAARLKAAETEARTARRGLWPKQKG
jgi:endonuclease YncB( thermonuclease family)